MIIDNIAYEISGEIDSGEVYGKGVGKMNTDTGESYLSVDFDSIPQGWDPRTITLICCSRVAGVGAREIDGAKNLLTLSKGNIAIDPRPRRGMVGTDKRLLADLYARSHTELLTESPRDISYLDSGFSHLNVGENGVKEVLTPYSLIMEQAGANMIHARSNYKARLENGEEVIGTTFYPHYLKSQTEMLSSKQEIIMETVDHVLDGNHLEVYTSSLVRPLLVPSSITERNRVLERV